MIFYFSGTGNSKWVATKIADSIGDKLINIADKDTLTQKYTPLENEKVGFVFPVYSWGPPKIVLDFIHKVDILSPNYLFFVCTCGDDTGFTSSIFKDAVSKRSWSCNAGFSVIMPNVYVSLPGFDVDDEAIEKNKVMGAGARIEHICAKLNENVQMKSFECYKGSFPFLKSYIVNPLFNKFALTAKSYVVNLESCIGCGKCEKACPIGNVSIVDRHPVWGDRCTQCAACYHSCPTHSIESGKMTKNKGQYKGKYLV